LQRRRRDNSPLVRAEEGIVRWGEKKIVPQGGDFPFSSEEGKRGGGKLSGGDEELSVLAIRHWSLAGSEFCLRKISQRINMKRHGRRRRRRKKLKSLVHKPNTKKKERLFLLV